MRPHGDFGTADDCRHLASWESFNVMERDALALLMGELLDGIGKDALLLFRFREMFGCG